MYWPAKGGIGLEATAGAHLLLSCCWAHAEWGRWCQVRFAAIFHWWIDNKTDGNQRSTDTATEPPPYIRGSPIPQPYELCTGQIVASVLVTGFSSNDADCGACSPRSQHGMICNESPCVTELFLCQLASEAHLILFDHPYRCTMLLEWRLFSNWRSVTLGVSWLDSCCLASPEALSSTAFRSSKSPTDQLVLCCVFTCKTILITLSNFQVRAIPVAIFLRQGAQLACSGWCARMRAQSQWASQLSLFHAWLDLPPIGQVSRLYCRY